MKTLILTILAVALVFVVYFKKRSIALWAADPFNVCEIKDFKSEDEDFYIKYSTYSQKKKATKASMLVLPPTGGKNIIDEGYALGLCRAGFKVYILEDWKNIKDYELEYSIHQTYQTRTQKAFDKMVEVMDGDKIGVLGTSAGGINFAVTLGNAVVAKKVAAFFTIVSGMPLCKVIAHSNEKGLKGIRDLRFEKTNLSTMAEYEKKVCDAVSWTIPKALPEKTAYGAIVSSDDVTVSTKFQLEMVQNYKPKLLIQTNHNHFYTIVASYFLHKAKIVEFFKTNLSN